MLSVEHQIRGIEKRLAYLDETIQKHTGISTPHAGVNAKGHIQMRALLEEQSKLVRKLHSLQQIGLNIAS